MLTAKLILALILAVAVLALKLNMAEVVIPSPQDEQLRIEPAATTKTANFNGTSKDLGVGFAPGGAGQPMQAVVNVTACDRAQSDETYTFVVEHSDDNGTFVAAGPAVAVTVAGAVATLGVYLVPCMISKRYVRLKLTVAGTTPSITYEAWLNPASVVA